MPGGVAPSWLVLQVAGLAVCSFLALLLVGAEPASHWSAGGWRGSCLGLAAASDDPGITFAGEGGGASGAERTEVHLPPRIGPWLRQRTRK
jgi:hypothetical protein